MSGPSNGRAAPTAPTPERTAARTGRVGASLEALAEHLEAAAASVRALAQDLRDELADRRDPRLMGAVPSPTALPAPGPDLLTAAAVAELLGVSEKSVRRMERERRLPRAMRPAGLLRWKRQTIKDWLDQEAAR